MQAKKRIKYPVNMYDLLKAEDTEQDRQQENTTQQQENTPRQRLTAGEVVQALFNPSHKKSQADHKADQVLGSGVNARDAKGIFEEFCANRIGLDTLVQAKIVSATVMPRSNQGNKNTVCVILVTHSNDTPLNGMQFRAYLDQMMFQNPNMQLSNEPTVYPAIGHDVAFLPSCTRFAYNKDKHRWHCTVTEFCAVNEYDSIPFYTLQEYEEWQASLQKGFTTSESVKQTVWEMLHEYHSTQWPEWMH